MEIQEKHIKPAEFAEKMILEAIIDQKWKAGDTLPPERELAVNLGITRPTLRETLQRLSRDGWITIRHGKPTVVNDYKEEGGIGILKTLSQLKELTPVFLIQDWLEYRMLVLPEVARKAVVNHSDIIKEKLSEMPDLNDDSETFSNFDSDLQFLFVKYGQNSFVKMTFNDIKESYRLHTDKYFEFDITKKSSLRYYQKLKHSIDNNTDEIKDIVFETMKLSLELWIKYFSKKS